MAAYRLLNGGEEEVDEQKILSIRIGEIQLTLDDYSIVHDTKPWIVLGYEFMHNHGVLLDFGAGVAVIDEVPFNFA